MPASCRSGPAPRSGSCPSKGQDGLEASDPCPCLADPPAESPSTRNSSELRGIASPEQSAKLARQAAATSRAVLRPGHLPGLARRFPGPGGGQTLILDGDGTGRSPGGFQQDRPWTLRRRSTESTMPLTSAGHQLVLGLGREAWDPESLPLSTADQALAHVVAGEARILGSFSSLFAALLHVLIDRMRVNAAVRTPSQVGAAVRAGESIVGAKQKNLFVLIRVEFHCMAHSRYPRRPWSTLKYRDRLSIDAPGSCCSLRCSTNCT